LRYPREGLSRSLGHRHEAKSDEHGILLPSICIIGTSENVGHKCETREAERTKCEQSHLEDMNSQETDIRIYVIEYRSKSPETMGHINIDTAELKALPNKIICSPEFSFLGKIVPDQTQRLLTVNSGCGNEPWGRTDLVLALSGRGHRRRRPWYLFRRVSRAVFQTNPNARRGQNKDQPNDNGEKYYLMEGVSSSSCRIDTCSSTPSILIFTSRCLSLPDKGSYFVRK
jgi:hypothetical protein